MHYSVMASLNDPIWKYLNLHKKKYLSKFFIKYIFLFNGNINNSDTKRAFISDTHNYNYNLLLFVLLGK